MKLKFTAACAAVVSAAACALTTAPVVAMTPAGEDAMNKAGQVMFEHRCGNCHAIKPAEASIAPPLHRVLGRRAGSVSGYTYSVKLRDSNRVWDVASLNDWLARSTTATPDIRFRHAGLNDAIQRDAMVAYIKAASR